MDICFNCLVYIIFLLNQRIFINYTVESHLYNYSHFVNFCSVQNCTIVKMIHKKINCSLHVPTLQDPWGVYVLNPNLLPETQPKFITWGPKESLLYICNILFPPPFTECLIAISEIFLLRWNFLKTSSRNGPFYTKVHKQSRDETLKSGSSAETHACYGEGSWKKMVWVTFMFQKHASVKLS